MKAKNLFEAGYAVPVYDIATGIRTYRYFNEEVRSKCWPKHRVEGFNFPVARIEEVHAQEIKNPTAQQLWARE